MICILYNVAKYISNPKKTRVDFLLAVQENDSYD